LVETLAVGICLVGAKARLFFVQAEVMLEKTDTQGWRPEIQKRVC